MKKIFLNLGCGDLPIEGTINVDMKPGEYVDKVVDLRLLPWEWEDASIDGIYMLHTLEHFPDTYAIIKECHRILKKGGFLYIQVPHSSNITGVGDLGHYRTFHYRALSDYLCQAHYVFDKPLFKKEIEEIKWWAIPRNKHPYIKFAVEKPTSNHPILYNFIITPLSYIIQSLINISPVAFERFWCYYVGGADEMVWKGIKI